MKFICVILLLACSVNGMSQNTLDDKAFYMMKYEKFKRMKNAGLFMTVAGGVMSVVGISQLSNAVYTTDMFGNPTTNDPRAVSGALLFIVGAPLCGGGVTLTIIGSNRMKKYNQKLDGLSLNLKMSPQQTGIALAYKF